MKFTKMHGCGNDYIYVDCLEETVSDEKSAAIKLSDRHFGIGGDGLILIEKGASADFEMVMYNPDGTRAEMCGNAIRCVARYVYDKGYVSNTEFSIESMGKVKYITLAVENDVVKSVRVDMGAPILEPADIPVVSNKNRVINEEIEIDGRKFNMTCVSMGNPHAVMFIDESPKEFELEHFGPLFENNGIFPRRTNAEFARVTDKNNIDMRVWERGTGETLACGTGTCATVVAAILNGYTDNDVTVHLLGGDLKIHWSGNESDSVIMTGPAEYVFSGEIDL
ncbi:MAG: diaminopimelate epimerase [Eubacterium sp.]